MNQMNFVIHTTCAAFILWMDNLINDANYSLSSASWIVLSQAVKRGKVEGFDIVLCDTSGRKKIYLLLAFGTITLVLYSNLRRHAPFILTFQVCILITA